MAPAFIIPSPYVSSEAGTVSYVTLEQDGTNTSSYSLSSVSIGAADSTREVILVIAGRSSGGSANVASGTIGGVSFTVHLSHNTGDYGIDIVSAAVPTGATADIDITMNSTNLEIAVGVYRAVNLISSTPYDTDFNDGSGASGLTCSVDVPAGGFVIAGERSTGNDSHTWSGATEDYDVTSGPDAASAASEGELSAETARDITVTAPTTMAMLATSWH